MDHQNHNLMGQNRIDQIDSPNHNLMDQMDHQNHIVMGQNRID